MGQAPGPYVALKSRGQGGLLLPLRQTPPSVPSKTRLRDSCLKRRHRFCSMMRVEANFIPTVRQGTQNFHESNDSGMK